MARENPAAGDNNPEATVITEAPVVAAEVVASPSAEYLAAQESEYGQFVATTDIFVGSARAYRQGDPVPASNVALHNYDEQGLVEKVS